MTQELHNNLDALETELGIPIGFFEALFEESPWSFVVKMCAFFQTLLALTISKQFHKPELFPEFSNLPFADTKAGLITMAHKMGTIDDPSYIFLKKLTEIRNNLAHNIKFVSFDWSSYFQKLDKNQKKSFIGAFGYFLNNDGRSTDEAHRLFLKSPQQVVHGSAMIAVLQIYQASLKAEIEMIQNKQGRELLVQKLENSKTISWRDYLLTPKDPE